MTTERTLPSDRKGLGGGSAWQRWSSRLLGGAMWTLIGVSVLGVLLRCTIRDHVPILAAVYYATPPVVLACTSFLAALFLLGRRRRRWSTTFAIAGVLCSFWWYQSSFFHNSPQANGDSVRVLFWNTCRGVTGWKHLAAAVEQFDADVIGLVEAGGGEPSFGYALKRSGRYETVELGAGMVLFSRYPVRSSNTGGLGSGGVYGHVQLELEGDPLDVFVVDVNSHPLMHRREALEELTELVRRNAGGPVVVMGDFNTPTDSAFLDDLRDELRLAFEVAGTGNAATWPFPIRMLTLDQVWISPQVQAHHCRLEKSPLSDHCPVITEISIVPDVDSQRQSMLDADTRAKGNSRL